MIIGICVLASQIIEFKNNKTILLDISYEVRKQRIMKRDNITEYVFDLRKKASINFDESAFDYVLKENNKEMFKRLVKAL